MPSPECRSIAAEDLYALETISDVRLSPDGRHVVYAQQRVHRESEKKHGNLWLVDSAGSAPPRQFTTGDQSDSKPRWSPDGQTVAFLSNRANQDKPPQLYLISMAGGEARQLAKIEGTIGEYAWSPDGSRMVCTVRKTDQESLEREKDENRKKLGVVSRHYRRLSYKLDGSGYLPHERWHLWLFDAASGEVRQLTDHATYDEQMPAWSPDGQTVAFLSNRSENPDLRPDAVDLYVMPAAGGVMQRIETPPGDKSQPSYSPDGRWIAYYGTEGLGMGYRNQGLWVVPADGSGPARNLTEAHDLHTSAWTINDVGQPEQMPPTWSKDGQQLYFPVSRHGRSLLMSISLEGGDLRAEAGDDGVVGSFSFDHEQARLAYFYGALDDPGQIRVRDLGGDAGQSPVDRTVTRVNRELLDSLDLGEVQEAWMEGPDGNDLQGWILTPPGFDPSRRYPSILEIHGGPLLQYGRFFMHEFYYLAAQGYVVHFSNPRGGRGYGEAHAKAIWGDWGSADYADLMAWTDYVAALPYTDPERMGVTGGSYGGYMTVWSIGHTQRFRAAVAARCVSNWLSMWGSSDINPAVHDWMRGKAPWEDPHCYWEHSPMAHIGNARTPTLVLHNEMDLRCPIEQGEQVYAALQRLGVDTEMVRFPEEFHGLSRTGRTDRRIVRLNHILRWFDRYLKEE